MPGQNYKDPPQPQDDQSTLAPGQAEELLEIVTRRPRMRALRIGAAATLVTAAVAVIANSGGGSAPNPASGHATAATQEISNLLAGIPQSGNTLGSPTAPVTLEYFVDLECSTARAFTLEALPSIIHKWVRSGKLRIEYRSLRTVSEPKIFGAQQVAALAAGQQDKLWYYLENFYHEQGSEHSNYVTESYLQTLAQQVPDLNLTLWGNNRHNPQLAEQVVQDEQAAHAADLNSTPSFLIGSTGTTPTLEQDQLATLDTINNDIQQTLHSQTQHNRQGLPTAASASTAQSLPGAANIAWHDGTPTGPWIRAHNTRNIEQTPTARW